MPTEKYPRFKRHADITCKCGHPVCTRVSDRKISRKVKRNGMIRIERFCDCLFCGPFSFETEIYPEFFTTFGYSFRAIGAPRNIRNAEIRESG